MARPRVYSEEERKQRKKDYDIRYQNERYGKDEQYREMKKKNQYVRYKKITDAKGINQDEQK
jgi:hypothetical protein